MLDKFLIVGCGGSGGRTVRYLRAELKRRLQAAGYTGDLPSGWGFVHVDVPAVPDINDAGPAAGLHYVGLASSGISYYEVDNLVLNRSEATRAHVAGWRPSPGTRVDPTTGAGQMRAVGRMVAAAGISRLVNGLDDAVVSIQSAPPGQLSAAATALGEKARGANRMWIIVLSSLAGGAGAGMYLDVCDVLRMLTARDGYPIVGVLYAPDIFADVQGAGAAKLAPNGLAALSELLAAYWDGEEPNLNEFALLKTANLVVPQGSTRRGPQYPFIVSRTNGSVTLPTQRDAFRMTAAALAGMMLSGEVQDAFHSGPIGNWATRGSREDTSGLTSGVDEIQPLSSFGYSSIGVGRDRFGVYSTQRLTGELVMHLLAGHRERQGMGDVEDVSDVAAAQLDGFLDRCGLQEKQQTDHDILDALRGGGDQTWGGKLTSEVETLKGSLTTGRARLDRDTTRNALADAVSKRRTSFINEETARVENNARDWVNTVQADILAATVDCLGRIGGRGTVELLGLVHRYLSDEIAPQLRLEAERLSDAEAKRPVGETIAKLLSAAPRWLQANSTELTTATQQGVKGFRIAVEAKINTLAAALVVDLADGFVQPLQRALTVALNELQIAADGTTSEPSPVRGWASGIVPDDLLPAQYDIMVESPDDWPQTYEQLLQAQMKVPYAEEARRAAVRSVLEQPGLINSTRRWSPSPAILNTEAGTARAAFTMGLALPALQQTATTWLLQPDSEMYNYTQEQLGQWLLGSAGAGESASERQRRFIDGLGFAFMKALPLIELDNAALSRVHPNENVEIANDLETLMTPLPMDSTHPAAGGILQALIQAKMLEPTTSPDNAQFKRFFNPDSRNSTIGVLRFLGGPVSPLVVNSIAEPLVAAADSNAGSLNFYVNNRARPLNHAVPAPPGYFRALVRGYFIGRLLGYLDVRTPSQPQAWTPQGWLAFREFLGPAPHGDADILGALCESMALAIVKSVRANADALRFHRTVAELGSVHVAGQPVMSRHGTPKSISDWLASGEYPAGREFAYLGDGGSDADARASSIRQALSALIDAYVAISDGSPPSYDDPYGCHRWDLAPEIVAILTELRDGIGLGGPPPPPM